MRLCPVVLPLAVALCLSLVFAAQAATADPAAQPEVQATPTVAPPVLGNEADVPPPFVRRPQRPAQPPRRDLTYASRPAPTSFRGLAWGTPLAEAQASAGLAPITSPKTLRGAYHRPDELLKIGQADVRTIAYYFQKNVFMGAGVMFAGEANFFLIKDHLMELYGPGRQVGDRYGWTWDTLSIDLRLRDGVGELRYTCEAPAKK